MPNELSIECVLWTHSLIDYDYLGRRAEVPDWHVGTSSYYCEYRGASKNTMAKKEIKQKTKSSGKSSGSATALRTLDLGRKVSQAIPSEERDNETMLPSIAMRLVRRIKGKTPEEIEDLDRAGRLHQGDAVGRLPLLPRLPRSYSWGAYPSL